MGGSTLIGPIYFHGRPSAADGGFDAANSGGGNLAPSSRELVDDVAARVVSERKANPDEKGPVTADLMTASVSGIGPHISPATTAYQVKRVVASPISYDEPLDSANRRELARFVQTLLDITELGGGARKPQPGRGHQFPCAVSAGARPWPAQCQFAACDDTLASASAAKGDG